MGISRVLPKSNIVRRLTLSKAKIKKDNAPEGGNILSAATSTRLDIGFDNYKAGYAAIITAIHAESNAINLVKPQRILLRTAVASFFKSLFNAISLGKIPDEDKTFYGIPMGSTKLPDTDSDDKLLYVAETILSGDILRIDAGGIAMSLPTIEEYTLIYDVATPIILALGNAKTNLSTARKAFKDQIVEINDLILHIWNEVELFCSLLSASAKRAICRLWGVRYVSYGVASVVKGKITDSITGIGLPRVAVQISGGRKVLTDALGNFLINTRMYGDLELSAILPGYAEGGTSFLKVDGEAMEEDLALEQE